jgi:hypothetical protein
VLTADNEADVSREGWYFGCQEEERVAILFSCSRHDQTNGRVAHQSRAKTRNWRKRSAKLPPDRRDNERETRQAKDEAVRHAATHNNKRQNKKYASPVA